MPNELKQGNIRIDLPINNTAEEITVMVIVEEEKKKNVGDFAGKMHSNIDWGAYQKGSEMSGYKVLLDTNAVGLYLEDAKFPKKYLRPNVIIRFPLLHNWNF